MILQVKCHYPDCERNFQPLIMNKNFYYFGNIVTLLIECFKLFSEVMHETKIFILGILEIS